jgi:ubiquinone/menaquinone biosynthesis C-methylase UbiE
MENKCWDRVYQRQGQVQKIVLPKVIAAARMFKSKGYKNVLDLACGTGRHSVYLAKEGFHVYAGDISENGLIIARQNAKALAANIDFKRYDMKAIPYPDDFFDAVVCVWSIDIGTVEDINDRIKEIFRVLKHQGVFITDYISVADKTFGRGTEIEKNTFRGAMEGLPDLLEHYSTYDELVGLFAKFHHAHVEKADHFYFDESGQQHVIKAYDIEATK